MSKKFFTDGRIDGQPKTKVQNLTKNKIFWDLGQIYALRSRLNFWLEFEVKFKKIIFFYIVEL